MSFEFRPLCESDYDALAMLLNIASIVDGRAQHQVGAEIREEFESMPVDLLLDTLAALSHTADFSVGCYCADEARCHRSVLRELLAERGARLAQ
jgi:hypothetical protein